jgi:hypothetical protein
LPLSKYCCCLCCDGINEVFQLHPCHNGVITIVDVQASLPL